MSEMVGKVARAIARKNTGSGINWPSFVEEARAAIEAMREPTEAMVDAGVLDVKADVSFFDVNETWQAMIDAALSEVEG